jgi:hypothetical protein
MLSVARPERTDNASGHPSDAATETFVTFIPLLDGTVIRAAPAR